MRKEYTMEQTDFDALMEACKPTPAIMLQCGAPSCRQENANTAWEALGDKMGFDHMTVKPGSSQLKFSAVEKDLCGN